MSSDPRRPAASPPRRLASICVFCGSSHGARPEFGAMARLLGETLAGQGVRLVYGGGRVGLMGVVANAVLAAGGQAVGIIPEALAAKEVAHQGLTELHVVDSMHTRKALMADLADAFIALPGGLGTLEEIFEIWTWAQLGLHAKPLGFLDVNGFYAPLMQFLDRAARERFLRDEHRAIAVVESDPEKLLRRFDTWRPPRVQKWITRDET